MITALEKFLYFEDNLMISISKLFVKPELKREIIKKFFIVFTRLGDGFVYPVIIIMLFYSKNFSTLVFLNFLIGFLIERILYFSIKNSIKRIRPFEKLHINNIPILPPDRYSFPSGHTSAAFLFAIITSFYLPALTFVLLCYALLVGLSRIILNLHYPTDVLIGSQLGISIAIISMEFTKIIV